jgi:hypothetical protein
MLNDLRFRFRALFRRGSLEEELNQELHFHFEQQVEKYTRAGMSSEEARRRTRLTFGGHEQVKEDCREAHGARCAARANPRNRPQPGSPPGLHRHCSWLVWGIHCDALDDSPSLWHPADGPRDIWRRRPAPDISCPRGLLRASAQSHAGGSNHCLALRVTLTKSISIRCLSRGNLFLDGKHCLQLLTDLWCRIGEQDHAVVEAGAAAFAG